MGLVVLVQPATNVFDSGKRLPTPPISLLCAARHAFREHDIRVVDVRTDRNWRTSLKELLTAKPVAVGTTSITGNQLSSAVQVTRYAKSISNAPVVWGGIHGTLFPDQVLAEPSVDFVVRFEGEKTFAELVGRLSRGEPADGLAGLSYRKNGMHVHNTERPFVDLSEIPDIPFEILRRDPWYLTDGRPTLYIETSRGCPSNCAYCYNQFYHKRIWRGQSAQATLMMLDRLRERYPAVRHLSIVDDNYFGNLRRTEAITEGLIDRDAPFTYQVQGAHIGVVGRMEKLDFERLRRSGCVRLDMGAESGSEDMLHRIAKVTSPDSVRRINRLCREAGIVPWFNFMMGFPMETPEDLRKTIDLGLTVIRENPDTLVSPFYIYAPYPGTALFKNAVDAGFSAPESIEGWRGMHSGQKATPWLTPRERRFLSAVYFLSIFIDGKLSAYDTHPLIRFLGRLYRPIARWRLKNRFFALMVEKFIFLRLYSIS